MKTMSVIAAGSARQNAVIKKNIWYVATFFAALLLTSCHGKTTAQDTQGKGSRSMDQTMVAKPKVTVKVNRHFDEKGNLIGFDSTYSSLYSNIEGDTMQTDSLFKSFDRYFNRPGNTSLLTDRFNSLFFEDSLPGNDFFHDDFFQRRYELNHEYIRRMMLQMDSVKNRFYEERSKTQKKKRQDDL